MVKTIKEIDKVIGVIEKKLEELKEFRTTTQEEADIFEQYDKRMQKIEEDLEEIKKAVIG